MAMTPAERYGAYGYGASPEELAQLNAELAAYKMAHPEQDPQPAGRAMEPSSRRRATPSQPWETRPGGFNLEDIYVPQPGTQPVTMAGRRLADVLTPADVDQVRHTWNADAMARLLQARDTGAIIRDPDATQTVTVQPAPDVRSFRGEGRFPYSAQPFWGIESTRPDEEWWGRGWNARTPTAMIKGIPDWMIGAGLGALFLGGGTAAGLLLPAAGGAAAAGAGAAGAAGAGAGATAAAAPSLLGIPLSTLSTIGTVSGLAGTGASVVGGMTDQEWLKNLGMALSLAGGVTGAASGLAGGINSLADVGRLASTAGSLTGVAGKVTDSDVLRKIGLGLGAAGGVAGLGSMASSGISSPAEWLKAAKTAYGVGSKAYGLATGAGSAQPGASAAGRSLGTQPLPQAAGLPGTGPPRAQGGVLELLAAAQQAQQRGMAPVPRTMNDTDWLRWQG